MFCSRQSTHSIRKLEERALRIINDVPKKNFQDLISRYKEYTIHQRNLQTLMLEIYKITNNIAQPVMNSLLLFRENKYNIRDFQIASNSTKKKVNMVLKQCHIDHLLYGQIYHKITYLKLLYMPSKQK